MNKKEEFLDIYNSFVSGRKGADKLLRYITDSTDFLLLRAVQDFTVHMRADSLNTVSMYITALKII